MRDKRTFRWYARAMTSRYSDLLWDHSGFFNLGYWTADTRTQREASENLVEMLLGFIPEKKGRLLDVACGLGASTRHAARYYRPEDIIAINLSEEQLAVARRNAPGSTFIYMDAANLDFPDNSFENVMCIEAAFHFKTRARFFQEAFRVLKPGGRLVFSDILYHEKAHKLLARRSLPPENYVSSPQHYETLLAAAGFRPWEVLDTTQESWGASSDNQLRFPKEQWEAGNLTRGEYLVRSAYVRLYKLASKWYLRNYLVGWAEKP